MFLQKLVCFINMPLISSAFKNCTKKRIPGKRKKSKIKKILGQFQRKCKFVIQSDFNEVNEEN